MQSSTLILFEIYTRAVHKIHHDDDPTTQKLAFHARNQ